LIKNVQEFKKDKCRLGVNIIVDSGNIGHIAEMVKLWSWLGANIKLSPAIVSNDSKVNNIYHGKLMPIFKSQIAKVETELYNSYHTQLEGFEKEYEWCPYVQILPIIGADCKVYVCHDKAYNNDGVLGDISEQSFKEFWFNGKDKFFKVNPSVHCRHHCVTDKTNKMVLEYLRVEHKEFV